MLSLKILVYPLCKNKTVLCRYFLSEEIVLCFFSVGPLHIYTKTKLKPKQKKMNALKPMNAFTYTLEPNTKAKTCTNLILFCSVWWPNIATMPGFYPASHCIIRRSLIISLLT